MGNMRACCPGSCSWAFGTNGFGVGESKENAMYGYLKYVLAKRGLQPQAVGFRGRVVPLATTALLLAFAASASADPAVVGANLSKYWSFRSGQRTKYIRVGTCQGCSMVSS